MDRILGYTSNGKSLQRILIAVEQDFVLVVAIFAQSLIILWMSEQRDMSAFAFFDELFLDLVLLITSRAAKQRSKKDVLSVELRILTDVFVLIKMR